MRAFHSESVIYTALNKNNSVTSMLSTIIGEKDSNILVLNEKLENTLSTMQRVHNSKHTADMIKAIENGDILLVKLPPTIPFPECLPFVKYVKQGKQKIFVNISRYVIEKSLDGETIEYSIDIQKLYVYCLSAYFALKLFSDKYMPPSDAIKTSAVLWARLFNKVLIKTIALSTNKERYDAFMYFAMKFFMIYYLECTDEVATAIANDQFKNKKNTLIEIMESKIAERKLEPYTSLDVFCRVLFNNDISNIKGMRVNNIDEAINTTMYMNRFIDMYNFGALGSLLSYPYFIYTVLSGYYFTGTLNNRALEDIVQYDKKEVPGLLITLIRQM